jgi:DsbC/DsbD-like thiol-disulfide interchange protein
MPVALTYPRFSGSFSIKVLSIAMLAVFLGSLAVPFVQASSTSTPTKGVHLVITTYKDAALTEKTHRVRTGGTLYVVVSLRDKSGHPVVWNGPGLLQITLSASAGVLSATNVFITPGTSNTAAGFGLILYVAPSSPGVQHLRASAVLSGQLQTAKERIIVVR